MARILTSLASVALVTLPATAVVADTPSRQSFIAGTDISYVSASGHPSWVDGSAGKLRYDENNDGLVISRAFADYQLRVADTLDVHVVAEVYDDGIGSSLDLTEAYLDWRPLTLSANRYRLKVGGFYPRISLENTGPAWSSPYTISSSAINTWLAEEVRIFGAEFAVSRRPQSLGGMHTFSLQAAAFWNNDPVGGMISWKGWSVHDRQSRFGDKLPLPPLPQIQPDGYFWRQDPFFIPFQENDDEAGWYIGGEWQYGKRLLVRAMRYDNKADPMSVVNRQYAWYTEFTHLGLQANLPWDIGLIVQWLEGETVMGPEIRGAHVVDVEYYSNFLLLTKSVGRHTVSARYDHFEATENDQVPLDENAESGHAWTVAYRFRANQVVAVALEWLQIYTNRAAWAYNDLATRQTEEQVQLALELRFGNR
jgi:hypothetical protein